MYETREILDLIISAQPDLSNPDDTWSNGVANIYRWTLVDGQYLYIDCSHGTDPDNATIGTDGIETHLMDWDHDCDDTEWIAEWGVEPELAMAAKDFPGECRVWHSPHYYQGTCNVPQSRWARGEDGQIMEFANYAAAATYVHNYYHAPSAYDGISACSVLSYGQASPDTLTICEA